MNLRATRAGIGIWDSFYEIIRCILEALQFAALLVVLDGLVRDNITTQTALLAFGIMLVSVIGTIIFWYLAHGKEGEGSYRMCEDKRIQIGNRMKYMPMGYFNSHSLGNLTSVSTATMSDLESMSFAIIVRTLVGVIHASIFSIAMCYFSWKISLIFFGWRDFVHGNQHNAPALLQEIISHTIRGADGVHGRRTGIHTGNGCCAGVPHGKAVKYHAGKIH
mgnify:CR=1 FL=1